MKQLIIFFAAVSVLLMAGALGIRSNSPAGAIPSGCQSAWVNTSTTVATSATQVLTANQMNCPARIENDSVNNIFCFLEQKTAASSSVAVNQGIKLRGVTSTVDTPVLSFGPGPGADIDGSGYNLNCIATGAASRVLMLRK